MDVEKPGKIDSYLDLKYINFVYALIAGRSCSDFDRWSNVVTQDVWDYYPGVKYFTELIFVTLPVTGCSVSKAQWDRRTAN